MMIRFIQAALVTLVVCVFAGCVRFHAKPLQPEQSAAEFDGRSLANGKMREFVAKNGGTPGAVWGLRELTLAAFYYHPDLDVARAEWSVADASRATAGERPNPTVGVAPGYDTTTSIPTPWIVTTTFDIPIETAGKRGHRMRQAIELSEAARLRVASVAWQVRSRVRTALINLYAATETAKLLREQQQLQGDNLRILERQKEAGAVSAFEVTQAAIAADSARLALRDAERRRAEGLVALAEAVGLPVRAINDTQSSFAGLENIPEAVVTGAARREALLHRADVIAALKQYEASESALRLEIAKQYPDVHFNPGYQYDQGDDKWSLGLTVTLPVFNQNHGAIGEAKARRDEAAARFTALQAHVSAEIERAVAAIESAQAKLREASVMQERVTQQQKRSQGMLNSGEIAKSDLVAVSLQLSTLAVARVEASSAMQTALGQLEDALQSPMGLPATVWERNPRMTQLNK